MIRLKQSAANFAEVEFNNVYLYFSYDTLIAFRKDGNLYITENNWRTTTGKHLNRINSDKKIRINYEEFKLLSEKLLGDVL